MLAIASYKALNLAILVNVLTTHQISFINLFMPLVLALRINFTKINPKVPAMDLFITIMVVIAYLFARVIVIMALNKR